MKVCLDDKMLIGQNSLFFTVHIPYIRRRRVRHKQENYTEYARMVQNPNSLEWSIMIQNCLKWSKKFPKLIYNVLFTFSFVYARNDTKDKQFLFW